MEGDLQHGPLVEDREFALRAVLVKEQWFPPEDRPSTALFDFDYFSVDIKSKTTVEDSVARMIAKGKNVLGLVEFNCGGAREIGFVTRDERDPDQPDNLAHAHTYNIQYESLGSKTRKKQARRLVDICIKIQIST